MQNPEDPAIIDDLGALVAGAERGSSSGERSAPRPSGLRTHDRYDEPPAG